MLKTLFNALYIDSFIITNLSKHSIKTFYKISYLFDSLDFILYYFLFIDCQLFLHFVSFVSYSILDNTLITSTFPQFINKFICEFINKFTKKSIRNEIVLANIVFLLFDANVRIKTLLVTTNILYLKVTNQSLFSENHKSTKKEALNIVREETRKVNVAKNVIEENTKETKVQ